MLLTVILVSYGIVNIGSILELKVLRLNYTVITLA